MDGDVLGFGVLAAIIAASGLASVLAKRTFHSVMFLGVALVAIAGLYILLGSPFIGVIQILVYVGGILTLFVFAVMFVAGDEKEEETPQDVLVSGFHLGRMLGTVALGAIVALVLAVVGDKLGAAIAHLSPMKIVDFVGGLVGFLLLVAGLVLGWLAGRHVYARWPGRRILGLTVSIAFAGLVLAAFANVPWGEATTASVAAANDLTTMVDDLFDAQLVPFEVLGILLTAVMFGALVIARPVNNKPGEETIHVHPNMPDASPADAASPAAATNPEADA